jgi:DNA-binding IclR family transcriptional regulator
LSKSGGPSLPLTDKERAIDEEAMVSTLQEIHDELDRAVGDVAEILQTLVALGRARPGDAKGTFVR